MTEDNQRLVARIKELESALMPFAAIVSNVKAAHGEIDSYLSDYYTVKGEYLKAAYEAWYGPHVALYRPIDFLLPFCHCACLSAAVGYIKSTTLRFASVFPWIYRCVVCKDECPIKS